MFLAAVIHLSGALVRHLHLEVTHSEVTGEKGIADTRSGILFWVPGAFVLLAYKTPSKLVCIWDYIILYGRPRLLSVFLFKRGYCWDTGRK